MNIILFGFRKCGKTYYGIKLAQKLHKEFIESDHLIEELYAAQHHQSLSYRDIAKKHGFDFFRSLEKHVVLLLLQKKNYVLSLGGGVVLDPENVARLQEHSLMIYLEAPKDVLKARILSGDIPYYLNPEHPAASFDTFYQEREPIYAKVSPYKIRIEHKSEEDVFKELCSLIEKHSIKKP